MKTTRAKGTTAMKTTNATWMTMTVDATEKEAKESAATLLLDVEEAIAVRNAAGVRKTMIEFVSFAIGEKETA